MLVAAAKWAPTRAAAEGRCDARSVKVQTACVLGAAFLTRLAGIRLLRPRDQKHLRQTARQIKATAPTTMPMMSPVLLLPPPELPSAGGAAAPGGERATIDGATGIASTTMGTLVTLDSIALACEASLVAAAMVASTAEDEAVSVRIST